MKFFLRFLLPAFLMFFFLSCKTSEKIIYFQGDIESIPQAIGDYSAVIQPDDLLQITVFAANRELTQIYNQESNTQIGGGQNRPTYLVDAEGNIEFPVLGTIHLGGQTRLEAIQYLKGLLSHNLHDPGVSITILNYRITVLGEVKNPGSFELENEKVTLLEAIGMAGDLTINGVRENILVIREEDGEQIFYRVNLTTDEIFTSPVYYLVQNDVIYVEPNRNAVNQSRAIFRDFSFFTSVFGFLIAIMALILR